MNRIRANELEFAYLEEGEGPLVLLDLEGNDPIPTDKAAAIGSRETTRQGTHRRGANEGQVVSRTLPDPRREPARRVDCGVRSSSKRRCQDAHG